jgi:hypothetical protein
MTVRVAIWKQSEKQDEQKCVTEGTMQGIKIQDNDMDINNVCVCNECSVINIHVVLLAIDLMEHVSLSSMPYPPALLYE